MNEKKLKARDFITIGIFTAILWVVQMVIMYSLNRINQAFCSLSFLLLSASQVVSCHISLWQGL